MYGQRLFEDLGIEEADLVHAFQKNSPLEAITLYSDLDFTKSKVTQMRRDHSNTTGETILVRPNDWKDKQKSSKQWAAILATTYETGKQLRKLHITKFRHEAFRQ